jgi:hypothetical protein
VASEVGVVVGANEIGKGTVSRQTFIPAAGSGRKNLLAGFDSEYDGGNSEVKNISRARQAGVIGPAGIMRAGENRTIL